MRSNRRAIESSQGALGRAGHRLIVLAALLLARPADCQSPPSYDLGEIVVTGPRPRIVERVTAVDVVTAEQIERSGARTVDEAIALLPGLFVRRGAEGVRLVDIRGLRTRNVLLLLDGVPLNSNFDGLFDPSTLSVESIAQIKLTRGSSSVLYGPGGNGGVVNVVTRAAGPATDASLVLENGFSRSTNARARGSLRRGALGLVAAGSIADRDGFELSRDFEPTALEDGGRRENSDRRDASVFAGMTFDRSETTHFGLRLDYRTVDRGKPPVAEDARESDFAPPARFERAEQEAWSVHAALTHRFGQRTTLRPALYLNHSDDLTDRFDDERLATQSSAGSFREDASTSTVGAGLQLALDGGPRHLTTLALDRREERWQASGFLVGGGGGGSGSGGGGRGGSGSSPTSTPLDADRAVRTTSLSIEHELGDGGPWAGVLGVGWARHEREDAASEQDYTFLVGGAYSLGRFARLRGSISRQIRFPTLRDLYGADRGSPDLDAERTLGYELGIEHGDDPSRTHLALALFRTDADDFIERVPNDVLRNIQRTRFQGIEVEGRHPLGDFRVGWSYTYLDAENRSPNTALGLTQNRPRHKSALIVEHTASSGLRLRGQVLAIADNYALSRTRPARALELGDYAVVGLGASQSLRDDRMRVSLRVENLLDRDYAESIGFPGPGRTVYLGLELRATP